VPLHQRDLTSAASTENKVSIDQLVSMMRHTYEPLRDAIAQVDAVWRDVLPRLDAGRQTLAAIQDDLHTLGIDAVAELQAAVMHIEEVDAMVLDDPLALGPSAGERLDSSVSAAADRVNQLISEKRTFNQEVGNIERQLADLRVLRARATAAWSEASAKIADPDGLIHPPGAQTIDGPGSLGNRAQPFLTVGADWATARHDHERWVARMNAFRMQLERAHAANRAPLDRRDELRGRLGAYRAKASRLGFAAITHPQVSDLADNAHSELFTAPVNLDRADELVERLGRALRQASAEATSKLKGGDPT
jgi:hypothetical protein